MSGTSVTPNMRLPTNWHRHVREAIVHTIAMTTIAFTQALARAANHPDARIRAQVDINRLQREIELLREEARITDARMERFPAQRRPHYPPSERLAILELRAARAWSQAETARCLLVTPLTVASWTQRLDEEGPEALVQVSEPVNRFPKLVTYLVRRLKALCPKMGTRRIASVFARAGLHLGATTVRRILKPAPKPTSRTSRPLKPKAVTARGTNRWVAVVVDHFSRRAIGSGYFKKEPTARDVTTFLKGVRRRITRWPAHLITDHGVQFTAEQFGAWCRRRGIQQRFGAIGKYGSLTVIERFIKSMKNECTRLLSIVPLAGTAFGRELDHYVAWYNGERPHARFGARTPDEIYFNRFPACRRPRFETRTRWPRRSTCAGPHALVRGSPGAVVELVVERRGERPHLPVVSLRRVA